MTNELENILKDKTLTREQKIEIIIILLNNILVRH